MKFKYKNQIIETPNLEKKLKRMKISLEDIEILEEINKPKDKVEILNKIIHLMHPSFPNKVHCFSVPINTSISTEELKELVLSKSSQFWNGSTGIKGWTPEYVRCLKECKIINGKYVIEN